MGFKTLIWTSSTRLSCVGCLPAEIVICVPNTFIAHPDTTYQAGFIDATLVTALVKKNNCGQTFYQYAANYDDAQVVIGANLSATDILGTFCKGCLTSWVEDLLAIQDETINTDLTDLTARVTITEVDIAALERLYFPPARVAAAPLVTNYAGLAIPVVITTVNTVFSSFTNTDTKPVWVRFNYETPAVTWLFVTNFAASLSYDYTITNDAVVVETASIQPAGGINNPIGQTTYVAQPNGLVGLGTGAFKVLPGKTISMTTDLTINAGGLGDVGNQVTITGPYINYTVFPADV